MGLNQANYRVTQKERMMSVRTPRELAELERRRWMDDDLGSYYILVNLADQDLEAAPKSIPMP